MTDKYVIGIDYGTESARAVLVETSSGKEIGSSVSEYLHGVMSESLPGGLALGLDWHLQDGGDYIAALKDTVRAVVANAKIEPEQVIGLGIDFTSCTMLPLDKRLNPLSAQADFADRPHSYVKLWKHHAAKKQADRITQLAAARKESFLACYGGKISSEWMFPKILQILDEDEVVFNAADLFMEAGDWLVAKLTQKLVRSSNTSSYKALWSSDAGYPGNDFFKALDERLDGILQTKMRGGIAPIGSKAGELTPEFAELLGLSAGTAVAVNIIDAHAAVAAVGAVAPGQLVMAMGTSTCQMLTASVGRNVMGICGCAKDGIIPDCYSYETGQVAVGDSFAWFIDSLVNTKISTQALAEKLTVHGYLEKMAERQKVGEHGLIALDWWNGNRTDLVDANLSGAIIGLTLKTKPEDIYRALLESTAYGAKKIITNYLEQSIEVNTLFACGGLPHKNKLLMQIYADVLNREIYLADSEQITALGAAIYAALAAGSENGGYDTMADAASVMAKVKEETVKPIPKHVTAYQKLYQHYERLHDFFGLEASDIMHQLKRFS